MNKIWSIRLTHIILGLLVSLILAVFVFSVQPSGAVKEEAAISLALQEDKPLFGFAQTEYKVTEGGTIAIEVQLSAQATATATVQYQTLDGTAKSGIDYISAAGVLTFLPSSTSQTFLVETIQNNGYQGDRFLNLLLTNPSSNAELDPAKFTSRLIIEEDEPQPTNTPSGATATPVFVDRFEPNNTLQTSTTTAAGAGKLCALTLWPVGDVDFFQFIGKANSSYEVETSELSPGIDTVLTVYDTNGNVIGKNDDAVAGTRASKFTFFAGVDGFYYAEVSNRDPSNPANQTYCFEVKEIAPSPTPLPLPTGTRVPGADACEYNGDFDSSCLIGAGTAFNANFVPIFGEGPDNDFYRIWVKPGLLYTCETLNLSSVNDTNMILYDQNHNGLGGNDDKAPGDFGSKVVWLANYTGWMFVLVGPVAPPEYSVSHMYTYDVVCVETVATPTAFPTATRPPSSGGIKPSPPTPTPIPSPIPSATVPPVTVIAIPPTQTRPVILIIPLPTRTPVVVTGQEVSIEITIYFDANLNYVAELAEGVENMGVAVYDNMTGELLAFGSTNEAGSIRFGPLVVPGTLRISIPFLQFEQIVVGDTSFDIRVAPLMQPPAGS